MVKKWTFDAQPKILAAGKPFTFETNLGKVFEVDYLIVILLPVFACMGKWFVFTSDHGNMWVMVRSRDFFTQKLLYPKLVIIDNAMRAFNNHPIILIAHNSFGNIKFHVSFRLVLMTRLALAYFTVTGC